MIKKIVYLLCVGLFVPIYAELQRECLIDTCMTHHVQFIEYCFSDFLGKRKAIIRPIEFLEKDLENGVSFDGSSIEGCMRITKSDMLLMPDVEATVRKLPWTYDHTSMVRVMCTMHTDKDMPYMSDPRAILKREHDALREIGYELLVGPEIEFYAFEQTAKNKRLKPIDRGTYADGINNIALENSLITIVHLLNQVGLKVRAMHHEVGQGQFETSLEHDNALRIADDLVTAKHALPLLFENYNKIVSFMPKPLTGKPGSGMHLNFSLFDLNSSSNAFYDEFDENHLSVVAKAFIAGVLKHVAEFTLLMNPTVNSYKRLGGHEAPKFICCGSRNRSALVRFPYCAQPEYVRAEIRSPDALCNPYLVFAAIIRAGMEGIKQGYDLPEIIDENLYAVSEEFVKSKNIQFLPQTMHEALCAFEESNLMRELLGDALFSSIIDYKRAELDSFANTVTDWELEQYLR